MAGKTTLHPYAEMLVRAVIVALMADSNDPVIEMRVTKRFKFPADFPKMGRVYLEGETKRVKVNARGVLKWLQHHGYTKITTAKLRSLSISIGMRKMFLDIDFGG